MYPRLAYLRDKLDTSIWFIPLSLCIASTLLSIVMLWFDRHYANTLPILLTYGRDLNSARQILSVVAGSTISVGGVAFSVTMVALTLTSGQYGPKMLRNFLEHKTSKVTLGMFLATFVYALISLTGIRADDQLQVTLIAALLLAFTTLTGFIRFIHQTATELQADAIIHRIGNNLETGLSQLVQDHESPHRDRSTFHWRRLARLRKPVAIASNRQGYVQSVNYQGLCEWCLENNSLLEVRVKAGDFIIDRLPLFKLYPSKDCQSPENSVEDLNELIFTGPMRTPLQDPEYPITQINQLAARALSPGINDPATAITCIDWFTLAMGRIVDSEIPGCVFLDREHVPRVIARVSYFEGLMKTIFAPMRLHAGSDMAVTARLMKSLYNLAVLTRRADRLAVIAQHARLLWATIEGQNLLQYDTRDIKRYYEKLQHITRSCRPS